MTNEMLKSKIVETLKSTIFPKALKEIDRLREALEKIKDAKCDPNVKPGPEDMTKNELMFCELSGRIHCIAKEALEEMEAK